MRNRILRTAALMVLLGCPLLHGQSPAPTSTAGKIGVLNIQAAIAGTGEGRKALAELQAKFQPRQQELQRQQQEIQGLQEQLQKQVTTLSEEEQIRLRRQIEEKTKVFSRASDDFNADLRGDRQDVIQRIGQKMMKVINDYAEQNGYALIMDAQVPVVTADQVVDGTIQIWYAGKDASVTEEIVKRYDAAHPASASSTPVLTTPTAPAPKPATTTSPRPRAPAPTPSKPVEKPKE